MYKIIAATGVSFFCLGSIAQDNFEGKITYRMSFSMDKENTTIEALFGDQKIKVLVKQASPKPNDKEDLILDFKNGFFYKITNHNKTYTIDSFKKSNGDIFKSPESLVPFTEKNIILLGYQSSAFTLPVVEKSSLPFENTTATFWYADSLWYRIPEKYASVQMVPLFTNGTSVGFGMKLVIQLEQNKNESSEFTILAVEPKKIPDSLLELPPGYTLASDNNVFEESQSTADSVTMTLKEDTTAYPAETLKPVKNPVQKKQKTGKKGIQNKSKSPVRKPDN
jgi:hypothetical protein